MPPLKRRKLLSDVSSRHLKRLAERTASLPLAPDLRVLHPEDERGAESAQTDVEAGYEVPNANQIECSPANVWERVGTTEERAVSDECSKDSSPIFFRDEDDDDNLANSYRDSEHCVNVPAQEPQNREEEIDQRESFISKLCTWASQFKIHLNALTALLAILSIFRPDMNLPKNARTILGTPRNTTIKEISPGHYWHRGLREGLVKFLGDADISKLELMVNIDGLPISESSTSVLWPILCSVNNAGIFVVGIYHGLEKPHDATEYLKDFSEEVNELINDGLKHKEKTIPVELKCLVCDAPGKAFSLGTVYYNSHHGCPKCYVEGITVNRRTAFLGINAPLRTDEDFRSEKDEDYHRTKSGMASIRSFCPVTGVVLDYMHLVCLGVMKKMILSWLFDKTKKVKLPARKIKVLNAVMNRVSAFIPREFARISRSFRFVRMWKATEFRQFLLYTGPVVLLKVFRGRSRRIFKHFLELHVAITLLCDGELAIVPCVVSYAKALLRCFVSEYSKLYGKEFVSHNVHALIHLADDVSNFGPLDSFSAFQFESFLHRIKDLVRKPEKPLQQIMRRIIERENSLPLLGMGDPKVISKNFPQLKGIHTCGKLTRDCTGPQFIRAKFSSFELNVNDDADRCCYLRDGSIVLIDNFARLKGTNEPVLVGRKLKKTGDLYDYPVKSSNLGIVVVREKDVLDAWPLNEVKQKCLRLPLGRKEFAVFPMLHAAV